MTDASPATPPPVPLPRGVLAAAVMGNALEFYDFLVYSFFAVYIGKAFFPAATPLGSLLLAVGVFGAGFVTRPLGGLVFGALADRAGRRVAMLWTLALITLGTLGLVLTPSYASIGPAAPLIVVAARLVQGLALGGEVGPSTAFLVESARPGARGLAGSLQIASQGAAILLAGLVGLAFAAALTPAQMQDWGWRAPFVLALLALPLGVKLRRAMPETRPPTRVDAPRARLGPHRRTLTLAVLVILGGSVSTYVASYLTTYAIVTLKLPAAAAMGATIAVGLATLVFGLAGGHWADRIGRKPVAIWPRVVMALLAVPAFMALVRWPSAGMLAAVSFVLAAIAGTSAAPSLVAIPELLPGPVRATGLAIAYALGVSLFGGSTQFVVTWLLAVTGDPLAPAWTMTAASVVTAVSMAALPETGGRALQD